MIKIKETQEARDMFLDILCNQAVSTESFLIPETLAKDVGGVNKRLKAKQGYELLLRIAHCHKIKLEEVEFRVESTQASDGDIVIMQDADDRLQEYGWQADCYIIGKYSQELRQIQCFDKKIASLLQMAKKTGKEQEYIGYLEQMIGHEKAFYQIDDEVRPILIYKGDSVCHNILNIMAEQLGQALERLGQRVVYFDYVQEGAGQIVKFVNHRFKAIVGIQSVLFSIKLQDDVHYVHEYIYGPKFNLILDHPIWMREHMEHAYLDFYLMSHDMDYVEFIKRYYCKPAFLFPIPGFKAKEVPERLSYEEKEYGLSFIGAYGSYWEQVLELHSMEREKRFLANRFLLIMRERTDYSVEEAFQEALKSQAMKVTQEDFFNLLYENRRMIYLVMYYYRSKIIKTILESGIRLDVFGDSWKNSDFTKYPNLICHPDVTPEESVEIWHKSKLSLSIMSWHKAGFTERMAGIMLAGCVLVTDQSRYLQEQYDTNDMLMFDLKKLGHLPGRIRHLLENDEERICIAAAGKAKTEQYHTWDKRADEFLELIGNL